MIAVENKNKKEDPKSPPNQRQQKMQKKQPTTCEECKQNPSKYTCPGCYLRSCSLPCVKGHKHRTGCSGKREATQFVPLSQFKDNVLVSDFNLLEETKRVSEAAWRTRSKLHAYGELPHKFVHLMRAAARRRTKLLFLPNGMSRREKNQSRYCMSSNSIWWTIEWRFHCTNVVILDHSVHENDSISSVIQRHLTPGPWNHQLKRFCDEPLESLKFFIRKYVKVRKSPFRELDVNTPMRQLFAKMEILEHPVIHVFLPSHNHDFEVVKDIHPETKDSISNLQPCQEGVVFKEEEIEDDNLSDDHEVCLRTLINSPNGPILQQPSICSNSLVAPILNSMDFTIDPSLVDSYSDLIAQIDPDDFIALDGAYANEQEMEEKNDSSHSMGDYLVDEELEEGEIAE